MFQNHLKVAFRNLLNNRFFSLLNLSGLAIGLAVSLALMLFVKEELSFDQYHPQAPHLYRIGLDVVRENAEEKWASVPNIAGPSFAREIPEVQGYCRFLRHNFGKTAFVSVGNSHFAEKDLYWADSSVFQLFDVPLLQGDPNTALVGPQKIVLSRSTALKMFGHDDPIGKNLKVDNSLELTVTGVFEDFPDNSTLDAQALASFVSLDWAAKNLYWSNCSFETYLLLHPQADQATVETSLNTVLDRHVEKEDQWFRFWLQPLTHIHLYSQGIGHQYSTRLGDIGQVKLLAWLALAVLLLAGFNYVNMTTARSQQRFREVGINKTLGASNGLMIRRFFVETALLVTASLAVGVLLLELCLPFFEGLVGKQMSVLDLMEGAWGWTLPAIWALVTFGAGLYPALFLSSFSPKKLLSPVKQGVTGTHFFRKTLVVGQFTVCVALIAGALVFKQQLDYISQKKMGFQPEQVVAVTTAGAENTDQIKAFNNEAATLPFVKRIVRAQSFPGMGTAGYSMSKPGEQDKTSLVAVNWAEPGFEEILSLKFLAGQTLPHKSPEDTTVQVVMNEAGIRFLGYEPEEALGKSLPDLFNGRQTTIVGVVEDFHFESLHSAVAPYVFTNGNRISWKPYSLVKLETTDLRSAMTQLESVFKKNVPTSTFEFTFLNDTLDRLYSNEKRLGKVVLLFTLLTVFVSCLGLFGLAAFSTERRTKEIGIRKVLGATSTGIVGLLSKDFLKPVVVAIFIAAPVAYFFMENWLQNFAYHIDLSWHVFALAGGLAVVVAAVTVAAQSAKAALADPVESLRSE